MSKLFNCPFTCGKHEKKCMSCGLTQIELDDLEKNKIFNNYKKNQTIFMQGNPAFGFYYVHSGKVKISAMGREGKESILRIANTGDIIGHGSLFTNELYTASAIALENCVVGYLEKEYFFKAIAKYPVLNLNIISQLSQTMKHSEAQNIALAQKNVRERFAALLLNLKDTYGVNDGDRTRLEIRLTREEMAAMVGSTIETLARLSTEFKNEEIIVEEGRVIYIISEDKLKQFANI
jgi:CRP-like cAMP-binding protein